MVSAVTFGLVNAMTANHADDMHYMRGLVQERDDELFRVRQIAIDALQRESDLMKELERIQRVGTASDEISRIHARIANERSAQIKEQEKTISALRQSLATSQNDVIAHREKGYKAAVSSLLGTAHILGMDAMYKLARTSPPSLNIDQPRPDVPAPEGYCDSPLTAAFRRAYVERVLRSQITKENIAKVKEESGWREIPFPVEDYMEWIATPEAKAALAEWDSAWAIEVKEAAEAEARERRLLEVRSKVEGAEKLGYMKAWSHFLNNVEGADRVWEGHGMQDRILEAYEDALRQDGVTADDLAALAATGYEVLPGLGYAPTPSDGLDAQAGRINPDDIEAFLQVGVPSSR